MYYIQMARAKGGVRLIAEWSTDKLPSDEDFLAAFKEDDEE